MLKLTPAAMRIVELGNWTAENYVTTRERGVIPGCTMLPLEARRLTDVEARKKVLDGAAALKLRVQRFVDGEIGYEEVW